MSRCRARKVRERAASQAGNRTQGHNPLPAPLDSGLRRNDELGAGVRNGGRIGECESGGMRALSGSSNPIFVPIAHAGRGRHTKM